MSEAIFASTNPRYDNRLFSTWKFQAQIMGRTWGEHEENMLCTKIVFCFCFDIQNNLCKQHVLPMFSPCSKLGILMHWTGKSMDNLLSYCGLADARISTSEKDLPVNMTKKGISRRAKLIWSKIMMYRTFFSCTPVFFKIWLIRKFMKFQFKYSYQISAL